MARSPSDHPVIATVIKFAWPVSAGVEHRFSDEMDREHEREPRHYAQAVTAKNVILWSRAIEDLDDDHLAGICLHEFGHILNPLDGGTQGDQEMAADTAVLKQFGVPIQYKGPKELQWVDYGKVIEPHA